MAMEDATRLKYASEGLVLRSIPAGTEHPLQGEMLVGREVECAIILPSSQASRYHAKINVSTNGTYIEDLHSTNGTYINGKKTRGRIRLSIGDEVTFDDIVFRFASLNSGAEDATTFNTKRASSQQARSETNNKPLRTTSAQSSVRKTNETIEEPQALNQAWAHENIEPPEPLDVDGSNTQMISPSHMSHLIERNKNDLDVDIGSGPRLIVMTAPLRGKLFELEEALIGTRWQIGRDENSNILLSDKTISANHALLDKTPEGFTLNATNSSNGMLINGLKQKQVMLKHNDKIQIGRTELLFRTDEPSREQTQSEPYVELPNSPFALTSTITTIIVIAISAFLTLK